MTVSLSVILSDSLSDEALLFVCLGIRSVADYSSSLLGVVVVVYVVILVIYLCHDGIT